MCSPSTSLISTTVPYPFIKQADIPDPGLNGNNCRGVGLSRFPFSPITCICFYFLAVVFFAAVPVFRAADEDFFAAGFALELLLELAFVAFFFLAVVPLLPVVLDFIAACSANSFSKSAMAALGSADAAGAA